MVKALKPLKLKKDSALWTGLLTHKIVRDPLEPDSRHLATLFDLLTHSQRIFSLGHSTQNLDAALLLTCLSPRQQWLMKLTGNKRRFYQQGIQAATLILSSS